MKVILREDIPELGKTGDLVDVKDGYGRNFLLPRHLAIPAHSSNLKAIGELAKQKQIRDKKRRRAAEVVKEGIEKLQLQTEVLVGEDDKLFGSVTSADIAELLEKEGVTVDKRKIELEAPLKALGVYTIPIKIERDVTADLKLWVIKKS